MSKRDDVVALAKTWIRTPFVDCARHKGIGVDCGQILVAVYSDALGIEIDSPSYYSAQHMLHRNDEMYVENLLQYCDEIDESSAKKGDIVLYKFGRTFSHSGILTEDWDKSGVLVSAVNPVGVILIDGKKSGKLKDRPRKFFSPFGRIGE